VKRPRLPGVPQLLGCLLPWYTHTNVAEKESLMSLNSLPADLAQFVHDALASGKYPSTETLVCDACRPCERRRRTGARHRLSMHLRLPAPRSLLRSTSRRSPMRSARGSLAGHGRWRPKALPTILRTPSWPKAPGYWPRQPSPEPAARIPLQSRQIAPGSKPIGRPTPGSGLPCVMGIYWLQRRRLMPWWRVCTRRTTY
jgi:hypothetical protein